MTMAANEKDIIFARKAQWKMYGMQMTFNRVYTPKKVAYIIKAEMLTGGKRIEHAEYKLYTLKLLDSR